MGNQRNSTLKTIRILLFSVVFLMVFSGCGDDHEYVTPEEFLQTQYHNAIIDAMVAEEHEIYPYLIAVTEMNDYLIWQDFGQEKRVLVVAWTGFPDSFPLGEMVNTWWGETWVTMVPEIRDSFFNHHYSSTNIILRLEQLLGLPKDSGHTHFVELWVKPVDLFRPTPDNEITDTVAQLDFPPSATPEYIEWFNGNIIYSYYPMRFPWTRLGYTYDWGNMTTEIGLSEFVLKKDSEIIVESVTLTSSYFGSN